MEKQQQLQKQQTFKLNDILISSKFECGNTNRVVRKQNFNFQIWISPDPKSTYCSWFYFTVQNIPVNTLATFTIMNMSNQIKLFKEGHLPVFKSQAKGTWDRISSLIPINTIIKSQYGYEVPFKHFFTDSSIHHFAFTFPWSVKDSQNLLNKILQQNKNVHFIDVAQLGKSQKNRSIRLLTVTNNKKEKKEVKVLNVDNLKNQVFCFEGKTGIFLSARVHPGEVGSSFILNGFLKMLFSGSIDAENLLKNFVFYIVPIINPDGVSDGNFRNDSSGNNLNRYYTNPTKQQQPEIYYIKCFLDFMIKSGHISFCLDLHTHVNKQGAFIYGNSINDLKKQLDVCMFAKIMSYNCPFFDYDSCNFSQKNMASKDKNQELSKEGASRVAIFKSTGLHTCWTLQCNYHSTKFISVVPKPVNQQNSKTVSDIQIKQAHSPQIKQISHVLTITDFQQIGNNIGCSILDYYHLRTCAPIFNTKLKNYQNFRLSLAVSILRMIPFKFDSDCRKLLSNLNNDYNKVQTMMKLSKIISQDQIDNKVNVKNQPIQKIKRPQIKQLDRQNKNRKLSSIKQINKIYPQKNRQKKSISIFKKQQNVKSYL